MDKVVMAGMAQENECTDRGIFMTAAAYKKQAEVMEMMAKGLDAALSPINCERFCNDDWAILAEAEQALAQYRSYKEGK